jgi:hypothetical protein
MNEQGDRLAELTEQLRAAAGRLRDNALPPEEAAALIQESARLAAEAGAELDRRARPQADPAEPAAPS